MLAFNFLISQLAVVAALQNVDLVNDFHQTFPLLFNSTWQILATKSIGSGLNFPQELFNLQNRLENFHITVSKSDKVSLKFHSTSCNSGNDNPVEFLITNFTKKGNDCGNRIEYVRNFSCGNDDVGDLYAYIGMIDDNQWFLLKELKVMEPVIGIIIFGPTLGLDEDPYPYQPGMAHIKKNCFHNTMIYDPLKISVAPPKIYQKCSEAFCFEAKLTKNRHKKWLLFIPLAILLSGIIVAVLLIFLVDH